MVRSSRWDDISGRYGSQEIEYKLVAHQHASSSTSEFTYVLSKSAENSSVLQEPVLFSGSVFENVAFGLLGTEKASLSETDQRALVKKACEAAYADEFIERLPNQYDTQVGERAMMLSGGQKQRIAIARSIVSDPKVLLLDEATSALDPRAEKIVQEALDNVSENRTTIVIAHKLSTVRNADNIAVMADGAIIEQGTHAQLIDANGAYARLVRAQDLGRADNERDELDENPRDENLNLMRTQTQIGSVKTTDAENVAKDAGPNYNLVRCVWIILGENLGLYKWFLILAVGSILGGLTYPAQAILFARIVHAFELPPGEARSQGNFYSLMFFVVALGNLVVYAIIGWFSNRLCQVSFNPYGEVLS